MYINRITKLLTLGKVCIVHVFIVHVVMYTNIYDYSNSVADPHTTVAQADLYGIYVQMYVVVIVS